MCGRCLVWGPPAPLPPAPLPLSLSATAGGGCAVLVVRVRVFALVGCLSWVVGSVACSMRRASAVNKTAVFAAMLAAALFGWLAACSFAAMLCICFRGGGSAGGIVSPASIAARLAGKTLALVAIVAAVLLGLLVLRICELCGCGWLPLIGAPKNVGGRRAYFLPSLPVFCPVARFYGVFG